MTENIDGLGKQRLKISVLLNSHLFFLNHAITLLIEDKFRLFEFKEGVKVFEKDYRSFGQLKAALKAAFKKSGTKSIKQQWSHFFIPSKSQPVLDLINAPLQPPAAKKKAFFLV